MSLIQESFRNVSSLEKAMAVASGLSIGLAVGFPVLPIAPFFGSVGLTVAIAGACQNFYRRRETSHK